MTAGRRRVKRKGREGMEQEGKNRSQRRWFNEECKGGGNNSRRS
jgi:hypothetical protein